MLGNIYGLQFIFSDKFYLKTFYFMVLDLLRFVSNSKFKNILPKTKKTKTNVDKLINVALEFTVGANRGLIRGS